MSNEFDARSCPRSTPIACRDCDLKGICELSGLIAPDGTKLRQLPGMSRVFRAGATVYATGAPARSMYAIREGMVKLTHLSVEGDERIVAIHTAGEVFGLEGFGNRTYGFDAIAVGTTRCCELPLTNLDTHTPQTAALGSELVTLLSRAALRPQFTRGSARERVTAFLLDLAQRMRSRGYDGTQLSLGLSRLEIANLLDTRIETISRTLQQLRRERAIDVCGNRVRLLGPLLAAQTFERQPIAASSRL